MIHAPGPDGRCQGCSDKLTQAHPDLGTWFWGVVIPKFPNAHVSWSYRGETDQNECVAQGTSKLAWPRSAHNRRVPIDPGASYDVSSESDPNTRPESSAIDLFQIVNGASIWATTFFYALAADIEKNQRPILWGGKWKELGDRDHFQINFAPEPPTAA